MGKKIIAFGMGALMALAFSGGAVPAEAGIRHSPHDLSSSAEHTGIKSTDLNDLCVFCHTPHAASTSVNNAPLWNRTVPAELSIAQLYDSGSLSSVSKPSVVLDVVNNSDARLCLSCHDGASLTGALINPNVAPAGLVNITGGGNLFDGGNFLTNDHPIGMSYAAAEAAKPGGFIAAGSIGLRLFQFVPEGVGDTITDAMWCASCHNVHNNEHGNFLAKSNAGSVLCLTCHIK